MTTLPAPRCWRGCSKGSRPDVGGTSECTCSRHRAAVRHCSGRLGNAARALASWFETPASRAPHHEGPTCHRETRPHPEEPATRASRRVAPRRLRAAIPRAEMRCRRARLHLAQEESLRVVLTSLSLRPAREPIHWHTQALPRRKWRFAGEDMSDIAEIPVDEQERPLPPPLRPVRSALMDGPILRTLLGLAWPNVVALSAGTCTVIAETSYIGRLGVEALAAMALVFPTVILTMTMSGGAMGGAVASAIARALGAGDRERAGTLAAHALLIGISFGLVFMLGMLIFGPRVLEMLGGRGDVLTHAIAYTQVFFGGAVLPWLLNTMAGVLRGTGNMKLPSLLILNSAAWQIVLGGTLGLGLGPVPQFGMRGVAAGALIAYCMNIGVMGWYLFSGRARVTPKLRGLRIQWAMFFDILKVGAIACFSPLQSVLTISIFTHMLAKFGPAILAGYGIGARLEFLLTSIAFSFGI